MAAQKKPDGNDHEERWQRDHVQSLERGLAVIRCLGGAPALTLAEVAKRSGMTRAAARRFLLTLERLGYVGRSTDGYHLLARTLELGYAYLSSHSLPQIAQPHMQQLAYELDESCGLTILDRDSIVYVGRVTISRLVGATLSVGSTLPAYCTSAGRVLLSGLPPADLESFLAEHRFEKRAPKTITDPARLREEVRRAGRQGWYLIDQEIEEGVRSLAAPVKDAGGRIVAAVNVSSYSTRVTLDALHKRFLPRLLDATRAIEAELRARR